MGEEMIDVLETPEGSRQATLDTAYDSNAIRAKRGAKGIEPVIPPKANRLEIIVYDKEQYKQRNKVERRFNKIKQFRRVATRYEKLKATFLAFVILALMMFFAKSDHTTLAHWQLVQACSIGVLGVVKCTNLMWTDLGLFVFAFAPLARLASLPPIDAGLRPLHAKFAKCMTVPCKIW
jgi:transposase